MSNLQKGKPNTHKFLPLLSTELSLEYFELNIIKRKEISESKRKIIPRKLLGKRNFYYSVNPLSVKQPKRLQGKKKI